MIAPGSGIRVYLACGRTDMRLGLDGLAMLVQQAFSENPFSGTVYAFRGRKAGQLKLLWHDGIALCMLNRRLERGTFFWPQSGTTLIALSPGQLATLLEGCEWRAPVRSYRPELAG
jgi:transposase